MTDLADGFHAGHGRLLGTLGGRKKLAGVFTLFATVPAFALIESSLARWPSPTGLALGLALLAIMALAWFDGFHAKVFIHEHALVKRHFFGTRTVRLDGQTLYCHKRILELTYGVGSNHIYLTVEHQGRRLKLSSSFFNNLDGLADYLGEREMRQCYPEARSHYLAGRPLDFGALRLQNGKLLYRKRQIHVTEVLRMTLEQGIFAIVPTHGPSPFFKSEVARIPNMRTLFRLLEEFTPESQVRQA